MSQPPVTMKVICILSFLLGVAFGNNAYSHIPTEEAWKDEITYDWENVDHIAAFKNWKSAFGKQYADLAEESDRFLVFLDNWKMINDFNIAGERSFTMRMNQFSDLTGDEFCSYGRPGPCRRMKKRTVQQTVPMVKETPVELNAPASIDWTNYNGKSYVTPVKDQGQCFSCFAFGATGAIESRSAIKNGQTGSSIVSLSEQQLLDCSGSEGNNGCNGGLAEWAFNYVEKVGGLCSESEYPYKGTDGTCKASSCGTMYDPITSYTNVTHNNATALMNAVAEGPVAVTIEADQSAFVFYSGGVLDGTCGTRLDHVMVVVGYGTDGSSKYWKAKNSWGTSWGMEGYVLICRDCGKNGNEGECGILTQPLFPVAK